MKKTILFILSVLFCVSCFAKKEYAVIRSNHNGNSLSGAVPATISGSGGSIGTLLNLFAKEGFVLEQVSSYGYSYYGERFCEIYVLSRSSENQDDAIEVISDDSKATEVARYNLQGIPVNENEKGLQIIVYSNYTTKTVIVE